MFILKMVLLVEVKMEHHLVVSVVFLHTQEVLWTNSAEILFKLSAENVLTGGSSVLYSSSGQFQGTALSVGLCNSACPLLVYSLAPFPVSDGKSRLHLRVSSRVYFGGGRLNHFCFLWIGYYAAEQVSCRGLGVKASSVSVCVWLCTLLFVHMCL